MCFAPQWCALFRHVNFQKWFENGVFCAFWLGNVLRATAACTFSTSQLPKVLRSWCGLHILTSKCASRHNGVQFFISHLARWLRTCRFSEPTFRSSGATNHLKNTVRRDFLTFSRTCIYFLLILSLLWSCSLLLFSSLTLPTSAFPSVHIVGSLTSKLPSVLDAHNYNPCYIELYICYMYTYTTVSHSIYIFIYRAPIIIHCNLPHVLEVVGKNEMTWNSGSAVPPMLVILRLFIVSSIATGCNRAECEWVERDILSCLVSNLT